MLSGYAYWTAWRGRKFLQNFRTTCVHWAARAVKSVQRTYPQSAERRSQRKPQKHDGTNQKVRDDATRKKTDRIHLPSGWLLGTTVSCAGDGAWQGEDSSK